MSLYTDGNSTLVVQIRGSDDSSKPIFHRREDTFCVVSDTQYAVERAGVPVAEPQHLGCGVMSIGNDI